MRSISIILLGFLSITTSAQKYKDYIVKDSTYTQGKILRRDKNEILFQKSKLFEPETFFMDELKEYGYGGYAYQSLSKFGAKGLFKRISMGETNLYVDEESYILLRNDTLTHLNKQNYRYQLKKNLTITGKDQSLSKIIYTETSIRNFIDRCNLGNCSSDLPYRKFGILVGYNSFKFNFSEAGLSLTSNTNFFSIGFFGETPLYKPNSLYLTGEFFYLNAKPSFYQSAQNITNYVSADVKSLSTLFSAKWIFLEKKSKAYLKAGPTVNYLTVDVPNGVIQTKKSGSVIEISNRTIDSSSGVLLGYHLGLGLETQLKGRKNIHFELKYQNTFNSGFDSFSLSYSGLSFLTGFNI